MPRVIVNPVDQSITPIPDNVPDEQAPVYAQQMRGRRQIGQGQGIEGVANIMTAVANGLPQPQQNGGMAPINGQTMPAPMAAVGGLQPENYFAQQQMQQQGNQDAVTAKLQQRAMQERQLEAEKDRAQQLKVEAQTQKNRIAEMKLREEAEKNRLKYSTDEDIRKETAFRALPPTESEKLDQEYLKARTKAMERSGFGQPRAAAAAKPPSSAKMQAYSLMPAAEKERFVEVEAKKKAVQLAAESPLFHDQLDKAAYDAAKKKYDNNEGYWPTNIGQGEPTAEQVEAEKVALKASEFEKFLTQQGDNLLQDSRAAVYDELFGLGGGQPQQGGGGEVVTGPDGQLYRFTD